MAGALCAAVLIAGSVTGVAQAAPTAGALVGRVTLDGQGVAGATVTLAALSMEAASTAYREEPLAVATSTVTGEFSLPLEVTEEILRVAKENSGYVNYVIYALFGDVDSDPYKLTGVQGKAYMAADYVYTQLVSTDTEDAVHDPVADVASYALAAPDLVSLELTAVSTLNAATDPAGTAADDDCDPWYAPYVSEVGREIRFQPVGEAHASYDMSIVFEYGSHANTDLTGAFSLNGGPFKMSAGASHIGNKQSLIRKNYAALQKYKLLSSFEYVKERVDWTDDGGDKRICRTDYRIRAIGWRNGYMFGEDVSRFDSHAQMEAARDKGWAAYYKGDGEYHKKTGRTRKFFANVEAFGVKLSAQSTWSRQVDLQYTFGDEVDHWLYGSDNRPDLAGAVYAW